MQIQTDDSEINVALLCLDCVSIDFSVNNMERTGLYGYVHDISVGYDSAQLMIFWIIINI